MISMGHYLYGWIQEYNYIESIYFFAYMHGTQCFKWCVMWAKLTWENTFCGP